MIRHVTTRRSDTVADAIGCFRAFGGVFMLTGMCALCVALFGLAGIEHGSRLARGLVGLIGASHLVGGSLVVSQRWVKTEVKRSGVVRTEHRLFRPAQRRAFSPSEVSRVVVVDEPDPDGDAQFTVALALASGEEVRLTRQSTPGHEHAEAIAEALRARLGLPRGVGGERILKGREPEPIRLRREEGVLS